MDFSNFEKKNKLAFIDKDLLKQAFTHRSYLNEHRDSRLSHNERLEFLGDAVLELVITEYLYGKYPDKSEGDLTAYRSALVNANTLAGAAEKAGMNDYLLLSKGEAKDTGRARQYILANTFESLVGALYLDQGYAAAKGFIADKLFDLIEDIVKARSFIDSKSLFQEKAQEKEGVTPSYKLVKEVGPDHSKLFHVGVYLRDELVVTGQGPSKQEAEQKAAEKALELKGW